MGKKPVTIAIYDAIGGPTKYDKDTQAGPTNAGSYVVAKCEPHSSSKTWRDWSHVRWGTPLRDNKGKLEVQIDKNWVPLKNYTSVTREEIENYHKDLFGVKKLPDRWVFNDFGHTTCKVFIDINGNRKLDGKEKIHGEFIHPTPDEEAAESKGEEFTTFLDESNESHGCVHVRGKDIDEMIDNRYLQKGSTVVYHKYSDAVPKDWATIELGAAPYEFHFYPGAKKIVVRGQGDK